MALSAKRGQVSEPTPLGQLQGFEPCTAAIPQKWDIFPGKAQYNASAFLFSCIGFGRGAYHGLVAIMVLMHIEDRLAVPSTCM